MGFHSGASIAFGCDLEAKAWASTVAPALHLDALEAKAWASTVVPAVPGRSAYLDCLKAILMATRALCGWDEQGG